MFPQFIYFCPNYTVRRSHLQEMGNFSRAKPADELHDVGGVGVRYRSVHVDADFVGAKHKFFNQRFEKLVLAQLILNT